MKTQRDPRHLKRREALKKLFAWTFDQKLLTDEQLVKGVIDNIELIDQSIEKSAPTWPISQINRIDLSILRLAIYELVIEKKEPFKVVVDEAVELAKEFGAEGSPAFINGALGKLITAENINSSNPV